MEFLRLKFKKEINNKHNFVSVGTNELKTIITQIRENSSPPLPRFNILGLRSSLKTSRLRINPIEKVLNVFE
jgi:hypothetical protein